MKKILITILLFVFPSVVNAAFVKCDSLENDSRCRNSYVGAGDSCYVDGGVHCPFYDDNWFANATDHIGFCIDQSKVFPSVDGYYLKSDVNAETPILNDNYACIFSTLSGAARTRALHHPSGYSSCTGENFCTVDENSKGTLDFGAISNPNFSLYDENYYIATLPVTYTGILDNYSIELTDAPEGTLITTTKSGTENVISNITAQTIYIKVPIAKVTSTINIQVKINASKVASCNYTDVTTHILCIDRYYNSSTKKCSIGDVQRVVYFTTAPKTTNKTISDTATTTVRIETGNLQLTKRDGETQQLLKGIEFKLYELKDGECSTTNDEVLTVDGKVINPIITKDSGYVEVENILYGTYCLIETNTLSNYKKLVGPEEIVIDKEINSITIDNQPIKFIVSKKAITGEDEITGATIKITDATGKILYREFMTRETAWEEQFEKGSYILTETIAPAGYMPVENSFEFTIDEDGKIIVTSEENELYELEDNHLTIKNETSKIYISKKDITNVEELKGAEIKIVCDNGYEVAPFVTGDKPIEFEALPFVGGVCTLEELVAPEGYEILKNSLKFKVDKNGDIEIVGKADDFYYINSNRIVIYNGSFPETGIITWIGVTIIGGGLVLGGTILIIRDVKQRRKTK